MADRKHGFEPVIDARSRVLILGSLPGDESLRRRRYYANPRNHFWTIISRVYSIEIPEIYEERLSLLLSKGIALWDVLRAARRDGSLDSAIGDGVANDFAPLFERHPRIEAIGFNGRKAYELFQGLVVPKLPDGVLERFRVGVLPSSSPTPGRNVLSLEGKVERWRDFLLNEEARPSVGQRSVHGTASGLPGERTAG